MPNKDLTFRLFGQDVTASKSLRGLSRAADESGRGISKAFGNAPRDVSLVAAAAGAASVKMAADFQTATLRLVTDAGESQSNLAHVRDGLLQISAATGLSAGETAKGMYLVESAGYHGAAGLKVMQAAAEGAKIGGADVATVADALTTAMTDYGKALPDPAKATSMLIATVGQGKTTMEALAGSLHSVLPTAAAAGLNFQQTAGAVATMTAEGISADQATQNLNHTIMSLQAPTQVQTKAMAAMGLSSFDVAKNLGKKGLTGTLDELQQAVMRHVKGGAVLQSSFNQSKLAAASADQMLQHLPASLQSTAKGFLAGTVTQKEWSKALRDQPALAANLGRQFATTAKTAHGFSDMLRAGQGPAATFNAQMSRMLGGQTGLSVALHLTGDHMGTFRKNVDIIGGATKEAGGHVKGWAETQQNFNQQLAQAGTALQGVGIRLGTVLLPPLTAAAKAFSGFVQQLTQGKPAAVAIVAAIGLFVGAMIALYTAQKVYAGVQTAANVGLWLFGSGQKAGAIRTAAHTVAVGAQRVALLLNNTAMGLFTGSLYANAAAMLRSKAETVALAAMYAKDFVLALGKSAAAFVAQAAKATLATGAMLIQKGAMIAGTAITWLATAATTAFGVAMAVATSPITLVVLAVAALVVGIILLVTHWRQVCAFLQSAWKAFTTWLDGSLKAVGRWFAEVWAAVSSSTRGAWNGVIKWLGGVPAAILGVFAGAAKWLVATGGKVLGGLLSGAKNGLVALGKWEAGIGATVIGWLAGAGKWLVATGSSLLGGLLTGAKNGLIALGQWEAGLGRTVLGFLGNVGTWLLDAGGHIIGGLVQGIKNGIGSVASVVGDVASGVIHTFRHAMGIASPSRVFITLGEYINQGLQKGLEGSASKVTDTMNSLSNKLTAAFDHLATQRTAAQKRLHTLNGEYKTLLANHPKLVADAHGKVSKIREAAYTEAVKKWNQRKGLLQDQITTEDRTYRSIIAATAKGAKSAITALVTRDTAELEAQAKKRDKLTAKLADAKSALTDAQGQWNSDRDSTAASAMGLGNVTDVYSTVAQQHADALSKIADLKDQLSQLDTTSDTYGADKGKLEGQLQQAGDTANSTANSTGAMMANLQKRVADTKAFQADLKQLLGEGLDPDTYSQLVSAGVGGGGLAAAQDLLSSGAGSVQQMADLQHQLKVASNSLGSDVAERMDGAGVQAAMGLVNGLQGQLDSVTAAMDKIADAMVSSIKKKLDIHSPSRVFEAHGKYVVAGLVKGLDGGRPQVAASVAGLVSAGNPYAAAPGSRGQAGQIPAGRGGSAPLVQIDNFHATPEQSPSDIAAQLGWLTRSGV